MSGLIFLLCGVFLGILIADFIHPAGDKVLEAMRTMRPVSPAQLVAAALVLNHIRRYENAV